MNDRAADDLGTSKLRRIAAETERTIIEAIEAGDFRGLSGEGMPLKLDGAEAGDRWAALHVLRNAEFVPEWSALRREIDDELGRIVRRVRSHRAWIAERRALLETMPAERIVNSVRATAERDAAARRTIAESVAELNRSIARYNALVPVFGLQLPLVSVEQVLREAS